MTVLVLGDQLSTWRGPLSRRPDDPVLMIEATHSARRNPDHQHTLTHLEDKNHGEVAPIRDRAAELRDRARRGEL